MFLKPAPGLIVRDPVTKFPLPPEGREVQLTSYWQRRLKSRDVEEVPPSAPIPASVTAPPAAPSEEIYP